MDIWNSSRHDEVIKILNKRWRGGSCKNCRSIAFNKAIDSYYLNPKNVNTIEMDYFL